MTALIVSLAPQSVQQLRADIDAAVEAGAHMVELRLDLMEGVPDEAIHALRENRPPAVPILLTIRSAAEGGAWDGDDTDRISRLIDLGPAADYIDVELAAWQRSANIRQKVGLALKRATHISQQGGVEIVEGAHVRRLILSRHDVRTRPPTLQADLLAMLSEPACHVPKLAWRARTIRDNFEALELMRTSPKPLIAICLGELGLMSRVLAPKFGAFGTFAALTAGAATAEGQLSIAKLRGLYRWDKIGPNTDVFGVIGDPVAHSIGPQVHNLAFDEGGIDGVYLPLAVTAGYESFKAFMVEVLARPWLGFRGLSVTLPHKENALRFLRESGGEIDPLAQRIGAVNTITIDQGGQLRGANTDYSAAVEVIRAAPSTAAESHARRAAVLGAGGVARAVVAALVDHGFEVTIFNRTPERAAELARTFGTAHGDWDARLACNADWIVNCTRLGMSPNAEEIPLPRESIPQEAVVFDTIYNPLETRLMREARERGCATVDGLDFFLHQAAGQFALWSGRTADYRRLRPVAVAALASPDANPL